MNKILNVFDYFKLAYKININNKELYKPQIVLIVIKTCFYILGGLFIYNFFMDINKLGFTIELFWDIFGTMIVLIIGGIFILGISGIVVESGLYNMYRSSVQTNTINQNDFSSGVKKFFIRFLLADILTLVLWAIIIVPYVIVGVVTLFAGFVIVPVLVQVFTSMWKIIIVMEDVTVIDGLKKSFNFAKDNFLPLSFLIIIQNSFQTLSTGSGSSGNASSNFNNSNSSNVGKDMASGIDTHFYEWYSTTLPYLKIGIMILIPVISIAVLISSLIKMIFQVFFSLSLFIMYNNTSTKELENEAKEVL